MRPSWDEVTPIKIQVLAQASEQRVLTWAFLENAYDPQWQGYERDRLTGQMSPTEFLQVGLSLISGAPLYYTYRHYSPYPFGMGDREEVCSVLRWVDPSFQH